MDISLQVDRHIKCHINPYLFRRTIREEALVIPISIINYLRSLAIEMLLICQNIKGDMVRIKL
jgi:hypothetical protein